MLTSFRTTPPWEHLELQQRRSLGSLELCLLHQGRLVGFSHARRHFEHGLRWLDPPVGLPWAVEILHEATKEWSNHDKNP